MYFTQGVEYDAAMGGRQKPKLRASKRQKSGPTMVHMPPRLKVVLVASRDRDVEKPKPRFRLDISLGLATAAMAILIVLFPPQTELSICFWLVVLAGLAIYPAQHLVDWLLFDWAWENKKNVTRTLAGLLVLSVVITVGYTIWPSAKPLKDLSNAEIRVKERELATIMREKENAFKKKGFSGPAGQSDYETWWNTHYLSYANDMRCDLFRRLNAPCPSLPPEDIETVALGVN